MLCLRTTYPFLFKLFTRHREKSLRQARLAWSPVASGIPSTIFPGFLISTFFVVVPNNYHKHRLCSQSGGSNASQISNSVFPCLLTHSWFQILVIFWGISCHEMTAGTAPEFQSCKFQCFLLILELAESNCNLSMFPESSFFSSHPNMLLACIFPYLLTFQCGATPGDALMLFPGLHLRYYMVLTGYSRVYAWIQPHACKTSSQISAYVA